MKKKNNTKLNNLFKSVERTNKRFAKMTPKQKRVQLAKDVIGQLEAGLITAEPVVYFALDEFPNNLIGKDLSCVIKETGLNNQAPACDVCAKGAIFAAAVLRLDKFPAYSTDCVYYEWTLREYVTKNKLYTHEQFNRLEHIFEYTCSYAPEISSQSERNTRLRIVMQNIIVSGGNFNQKLEPHLWKGEWRIPGYRKPYVRKPINVK